MSTGVVRTAEEVLLSAVVLAGASARLPLSELSSLTVSSSVAGATTALGLATRNRSQVLAVREIGDSLDWRLVGRAYTPYVMEETMNKALWFVVRDIPHREGPFGETNRFPPLEETRRKIIDEIRRITREPLTQGRTIHGGPNAQIESGAADSQRLQIVEIARKPMR